MHVLHHVARLSCSRFKSRCETKREDEDENRKGASRRHTTQWPYSASLRKRQLSPLILTPDTRRKLRIAPRVLYNRVGIADIPSLHNLHHRLSLKTKRWLHRHWSSVMAREIIGCDAAWLGFPGVYIYLYIFFVCGRYAYRKRASFRME